MSLKCQMSVCKSVYNHVTILKPPADPFLCYIYNISMLSMSNLVSKNTTQNIHLVLGNESCDLDSAISSLALAYFLNANQTEPNKSIVLPIMNVPKDEFQLRPENTFVLERIGVNSSIIDCIPFRDTLNLSELASSLPNLKITLVDHHVLSRQQEFLRSHVVGIFDHRPVDPNVKWDDSIRKVIKPVGSCSTLITEEILSKNRALLSESLAKILYETIIFDTIGLSSTAGKVKKLDKEMIEQLENYLRLEQPNHTELFNTLWKVHNNVSNFTPKQILIKDLKAVDKVFIPGVPMLVKDFLQLPNAFASVEEFYREKNAEAIIIMGLEAKDDIVQRDLGFYSLEPERVLNLIIDHLKESELLQLREEDSPIPEIRYFKQHFKPSRKQLLPLVKHVLKQLSNDRK